MTKFPNEHQTMAVVDICGLGSESVIAQPRWNPIPEHHQRRILSLKGSLISFMSNYVAVTKQSYWLASLLGILSSLQSLKREAIVDGQEDNASRLCSGAQSSTVRGQWRKIQVLVFGLTPQNMHGNIVRTPLLARLSVVKRRSWYESHMYTLIFSGACVVQSHRK